MSQGHYGNELLLSWRDAVKFLSLDDERRNIVFYSEGASYGKYFAPVLTALIDQGELVSYLTSDLRDPILKDRNDRLTSFYIGSGSIRALVFRKLRADILVTTTPDLESFSIIRSKAWPVHYVYLHHSMVSTHMIYREGAFDHFDSILCVGPHHVREIRAWEALNGLRAKRLFEHGYGPLDYLMGRTRELPAPGEQPEGLTILLAPSWGPTNVLEYGAEALVQTLINAGYRLVVRPHPRTTKTHPRQLDALAARFGHEPRFRLDEDTTTLSALAEADIMISDWSGVAMEFSFGLGRPVLFLDVPPKVNNPRWAEIGIRPLEDFYRQEVGVILENQRVDDAAVLIETLWRSAAVYATRANMLRQQFVFNPGSSDIQGALILKRLAEETRANRMANRRPVH